MTNSKVLVLNKNFMPIHVSTAQECIGLLFREKAVVVESDYSMYNLSSWEEMSVLRKNEEDFLYLKGSGDYILGIPKVIRLLDYSKNSFKLRLTRKNILLRDDYTCQFCTNKFKTEELTLDHIIPKSKGGKNTWTNLVCACVDCNRKKSDKSLKDSGMKLLKNPTKPSQYLIFKKHLKYINNEPYKTWHNFFPENIISELYWNTEIID